MAPRREVWFTRQDVTMLTPRPIQAANKVKKVAGDLQKKCGEGTPNLRSISGKLDQLQKAWEAFDADYDEWATEEEVTEHED